MQEQQGRTGQGHNSGCAEGQSRGAQQRSKADGQIMGTSDAICGVLASFRCGSRNHAAHQFSSSLLLQCYSCGSRTHAVHAYMHGVW